MRRKIIKLVIPLFLFPANLIAGPLFQTPSALKDFETMSVYSTVQDNTGALWFNSAHGLFRFNGHTLDDMKISTPKVPMIYSSCGDLFLCNWEGIIRFDTGTLEYTKPEISGIAPIKVIMAGNSEGIIVGTNNLIYSIVKDSVTLIQRLPEEISISALCQSGDRILIGTDNHGLMLLDNGVISTVSFYSDCIRSIYLSSRGRLYLGFNQRGVAILDANDFHEIIHIDDCEGKTILNARTIIEDEKGVIYIGSTNGLFYVTEEGKVFEQIVKNVADCPVCHLMKDDLGNLWASTYYNGLLMSEKGVYSFENLQIELPKIKNANGMVQDNDGRIWLSSDGDGLFCCDIKAKKCIQLPETKGVKCQCVYYDEIENAILAGTYLDGLLKHDLKTGKTDWVKFADKHVSIICTITRKDSDILLASNTELFYFNPKTERTICRQMPSIINDMHEMSIDKSGTLWMACSNNIYIQDNTGIKALKLEEIPIWDEYNESNYNFPSENIWMKTKENGVVCISEGGIKIFNTDNIGILDDYSYCVKPLGEGKDAVVATALGISVISSEDKKVYNFPNIRGSALCRMKDSSVLIWCDSELITISAGKLRDTKDNFKLCLDHLNVNGQLYKASSSLSNLEVVKLDHSQRNLSLDVTSFSYALESSLNYYYKTEGIDRNWVQFDINFPIIFTNIAPGRYPLQIKAVSKEGEEVAKTRTIIKIAHAWYASPLAISLFFCIILGSLFSILFLNIKKRVLSEKLRRIDMESREKTRLFTEVSNQMRTPLNLMIGNIEKFFKDFGSRTAGIENIEDIYNKAKSLREIIYEYTDKQTESLEEVEDNPSMVRAAKNTKFLNAATGAVERNLYTEGFNVNSLCSELNLGKTTLTKKMKEACAMSPHEFIEDLRLSHAAKMIKDGTYRISEISELLGFCNPTYFGICFKKKYGVSPNRY